jgi:hypothetical protein
MNRAVGFIRFLCPGPENRHKVQSVVNRVPLISILPNRDEVRCPELLMNFFIRLKRT